MFWPSMLSYLLKYWHLIQKLAHIIAANQLSKEVEDDKHLHVSAPTLETWKNSLAPGFGLAQLRHCGHLGRAS